MKQNRLSDSQIHALDQGIYDLPFAVLGMHTHPSKKALVVRAFLPGAERVEVFEKHTGKLVKELERTSSQGLFEGTQGRRSKPFAYQLKVHYPFTAELIDDPYAFPSLIEDKDLYLFAEGTHEQLYHCFGANHLNVQGVDGILFVVWAPNAKRVSVVGDFNFWDARKHLMRLHHDAGVWEIFIPGVKEGQKYKFQMADQFGNNLPLKADPFAKAMEMRPATSSVIAPKSEQYQWCDNQWMEARQHRDTYSSAVSFYEVHLGSWRREDGGFLSYRDLAEQLIPYVKSLGFTQIQLMPISEYPFDGSWGYQPVGLFAPTSRFGSPDDFKYFIDQCHQHDLAVLLDWVPGHFPTDDHGLGRFDGTCLYEHEDVRKGFHPDWNTLIYNYGRPEVVSFLLSNAMYWLDEFHIDGLRVDAVASMLYLDYSREEGQWIPNKHGGRENLEAINLLQQVNSRTYFNYPGVMVIAEESTSWPGVSKPVTEGGLGFGFKWNMGWMNDTLSYIHRDPIHRQYHHHEMTFGLVYGFSENFVLPISHDEVVHGKGSMLSKMPGDRWQQFANLRAYYGFMWTHPGKKLLFMGNEFAQEKEWNHDQSLDWHLLDQERHQGIQRLIKDLNRCYRDTPALHQLDCQQAGFQWIDHENDQQSIFSYIRWGHQGEAPVVVISNMTPKVYRHFKLGVPVKGGYQEMINTDADIYGGSNTGNLGFVESMDSSVQGFDQHLELSIPPLATVVLKWIKD